MRKIKLKEKVDLSIWDCNSYSTTFCREFKKKYPEWRKHNAAIYLDNCRVTGPKDFNTTLIYDHARSGHNGIKTKNILKALGLSEEVINEHFDFDTIE